MATREDHLGKTDTRLAASLAGGGAPHRSLTMEKAPLRNLMAVELPLLALTLMVLSISVMVTPDLVLRATDVGLPWFYVCPFFEVTGIPCLFCGMTRSFMAMGGLDIGQAFIFHPLGPVLFMATVGLGAVLAVAAAGKRRVRFSPSPALRRRLVSGGVAVLILSWFVKVIVWRQTGLL